MWLKNENFDKYYLLPMHGSTPGNSIRIESSRNLIMLESRRKMTVHSMSEKRGPGSVDSTALMNVFFGAFIIYCFLYLLIWVSLTLIAKLTNFGIEIHGGIYRIFDHSLPNLHIGITLSKKAFPAYVAQIAPSGSILL